MTKCRIQGDGTSSLYEALLQGEIEEKLDLTKNQAPSQADAEPAENNEEQNSEAHTVRKATKRRVRMTV